MKLSFTDVELPPQVHLKLKDLQNASLADLKIGLSFSGDSMIATDTAIVVVSTETFEISFSSTDDIE